MSAFLEELYFNWWILQFQNLLENFLQHPDQIPFLQKFRMVRYEM